MMANVLLEVGIALVIIIICWAASHIVESFIMFGISFLIYMINKWIKGTMRKYDKNSKRR